MSEPTQDWTRRPSRVEFEGPSIGGYEGYNDALFVKERTKVHALYIQETQRTRRLGIACACVLLLAAVTIPVFAPAGRESISWGISICLFAFSAGAIGYTEASVRMKKRSMTLSGLKD